MTERTTSRLRAGIVALAPLILLAAFVWHPYLPGRLPNASLVADAVADGPARWGLAHITAAVASGVVVLAFLGIRVLLRERGNDSWSALGLPFVVLGSTLYAFLPGVEFAPLAVVGAGGDAEAAQAALEPWFLPLLLTGAVTFTLGVLGFAKGIASVRVLGRGMTGLVVVALVVFAASRLVPLFAIQAYVQVAAAIVALWPLARRMWGPLPAPVKR